MMLLHVLLLLCTFPPLNAKGRLRKFYIGEKSVSRTDAVKECTTHCTDLVTVYDQQDNMELSTLLSVSKIPSGWIGVSRGNHSKKWSNGDDVTYRQYFRMDSKETCCAAMNADGDWESFECNRTKYFMCYEQDVGQASHNYTLILLNKTWFEAQLYCRENHADLVSIRNVQENERVKKAVNENTTFWIGLLEDSVKWNDEGQSAYRHWKSQYLQSDRTEVYMLEDGTWSKMSVGEYRPLCYKSFIHISKDEMSWEEALDYCNSQLNTSGLLCIESVDDQIETERELKRHNISETVWVGLRQSRLFGFWIWYNGLHVGTWTNWKGGSAPEHLISEHCGAIEKVNGTFKWSDKDCRSKFKVLCEGKQNTTVLTSCS